MTIKVTWLGHSGFRLDLDNLIVLIDPFLTGNPLATIDPKDLRADYIMLTHVHGDHLGDSVSIAKRTGATVIGVWEVHAWMQKQGIARTHAMNTGGGYTFPFGHVKFVRADHSSSFPDGTYGGNPCGIILTADEKRLYFAGDTALFSDMQLFSTPPIDVAFLPIGDNFTMGPEDSLRAIEYLQPRSVFPVHYDTFEVIQQDVVGWARRVHNETSASAIIVDPGSSFNVD